MEAGVTGFLFSYPCISREARKHGIYTDGIQTGVQRGPDWRSLPLPLLLFILLLPQYHVQERQLDPRCYFYWREYCRSVRPPRTLQTPLATSLTAGQTYRHCMYTSFDVFQAVSKGQSFHKTHGEPYSGCVRFGSSVKFQKGVRGLVSVYRRLQLPHTSNLTAEIGYSICCTQL